MNALKAIIARLNGVFDDPDLIAFGALGDTASDVLAIAERGDVTPPAIAAALDMVARHHPTVVRVLFLDDSNGCGVWQYQDADGEAVPFSDAVDVGALEDALDAAEAFGLPCVFERDR